MFHYVSYLLFFRFHRLVIKVVIMLTCVIRLCGGPLDGHVTSYPLSIKKSQFLEIPTLHPYRIHRYRLNWTSDNNCCNADYVESEAPIK